MRTAVIAACMFMFTQVAPAYQAPANQPAADGAQPPAQAQPQPEPLPPEAFLHPVEVLRKQAARLLPLMKCESSRRFLIATSYLPVVDARTIYWDRAARRALTPEEFEALPEADRGTFEPRELDAEFYYSTRYGTPLAYARPIELVCERLKGENRLARKKVLDFGYGSIGHLRLLASIGCDVHGVEIDPILRALYTRPGDTGPVEPAPINPDATVPGSLTLHHGRWPGDAGLAPDVGTHYDLFISKNTLKNGYIHPEKDVDKRMLIDLGVPDAEFVQSLASIMNPGGIVMIYNLCPAQKEPYIPWADGRCPFPRELLESAGFEVLEYDADDTPAARAMGEALGWDAGDSPMDLRNDLFAWYTLLRRSEPAPRKPE